MTLPPLLITPLERPVRVMEMLARRLPAEAVAAPGDFAKRVRMSFLAKRPVIGVCAAGILIRILAPLLKDKHAEPPVIALSPHGETVVPLLGGHHGANLLARRIAWLTGGTAALTTASDVLFGLSPEDPPDGWRLANPENVKPFVSALAGGKRVRIDGKAEWLDTAALPTDSDGPLRISISEAPLRGGRDHLVYHPATVCIGVGTARGASSAALRELVFECLEEAGLSPLAVAATGTVALKADEPAVRELAGHLGVPLRVFDAEDLAAVDVPSPSAAVRKEIGTSSVCEAAAMLLAGPEGRLVLPKRKRSDVTCAVAVAPAPLRRLAGRPAGLLQVVGLGPGNPGSRTFEVTEALAEATDWVGYDLYLELAGDLAAGKKLHAFPLGAERERVEHALRLAAEGRRVALLCSGDPGIYAMASLVFEVRERSADASLGRVPVEVLPGISAFQAASARCGAMIGHDFCTISLSDLLTPWDVIERRIEMAARGDFVTAFYNPRSRRRTAHLDRALDIMRRFRPSTTPVIVAASLGRDEERIEVRSLEDIDTARVDMLSIVLVGNSESRKSDGVPIVWTPRGYERKNS